MVDPQNIDLLLYLTVHVKTSLLPDILSSVVNSKNPIFSNNSLCLFSQVGTICFNHWSRRDFFLRKRTSFPASLLTTVPLIAEPWHPNQLFTPSIQPPNILLPLKYFPPCPLPPPLFLICLLLILRVYSTSQFKRLFLRDQVTSSHYYLTALYASPSSHLAQLKLSICARVCLIFLAPTRL